MIEALAPLYCAYKYINRFFKMSYATVFPNSYLKTKAYKIISNQRNLDFLGEHGILTVISDSKKKLS
ncbi:hypothetical protein J2X77_002136 [Sphingobacterium sp. 2149]|nr:hypothetical protein [Sphingobacterium sp. 2149]